MLVPQIGRPCTESLQFHNVFFCNFMAFIQKKINVRGEFAKDDSLDALNMATMPWYAMVILEDHVMVLHSG